VGYSDSIKNNVITLVKAFLFSFICQFLYEYTGYNSMIAESSIRYATGSTLVKYTTRRRAVLETIYAQSDKSANIRANYEMLALFLEKPKLLYKINKHKNATIDDIMALGVSRENATKILSMGREKLRELPDILLKADEDTLRILINQ
jgi:hypothetical protein